MIDYTLIRPQRKKMHVVLWFLFLYLPNFWATTHDIFFLSHHFQFFQLSTVDVIQCNIYLVNILYFKNIKTIKLIITFITFYFFTIRNRNQRYIFLGFFLVFVECLYILCFMTYWMAIKTVVSIVLVLCHLLS